MPLVPKKLLQKVTEHFEGNAFKANLWFEISNPVLNGMKPKDYHQAGKWDRLERMIDDALKGEKDEFISAT